MAAMAAFGWDTMDTCDPAVSVMSSRPAPPCRVAWRRDDAILGSDHAQLGMVFQAVAVVGAVFAPR